MTADGVTLWALMLAGLLATSLFVATRRLYFGIVAPALLYLSADELADLHERSGRWLERQGLDAPGIQDADSMVLLTYGVALTFLSVRYRAELVSAPWAGAAFAGAFVLGGFAVAMDALVPHGAAGAHGEEYLEAGAALCLAAVFLAHAVAVCREWKSRAVAPGLPGEVPGAHR
jgi:hypothetical protein